ncbi:TPA: AMP-binding protein [Streptococcus pyogenes]|nr:AMP-binding protein [Streptococcus pyogenes]HEP4634367.1 AMP-binding protein [Streptococcus pyogenes]
MLTKLEYWAKQCPNKKAIVADQISLTYQELWQAVLIKDQTIKDSVPYIISHSRYLNQLLSFLRGLKEGSCPIILHPNISGTFQQQIKHVDSELLKKADFAVLSSGTTGKAKLFWRCLSTWTRLFDYQNKVFGMTGNSCLFLHGSFSFTGNLNLALAQLWAGGCLVLSQKLSLKTWLSLWQAKKVSHLYLLPTYLNRLLPYLTKNNMTATHLLTSSQMISQELLRHYYKNFPQLEIVIFYGASELSFITWCNGRAAVKINGLVGQPFPDVSISFKDKEIFVETPYSVEGMSQPYSVSDLGKMSPAGLILEGRQDDWVNQRGVKCHLPSLVELAHQAPNVKEAHALKIGKGENETLILVLVLTKKDCLAPIKDFLALYLNSGQLPKYYLVIDCLPLKDNGKINREVLLNKIPKQWLS